MIAFVQDRIDGGLALVVEETNPLTQQRGAAWALVTRELLADAQLTLAAVQSLSRRAFRAAWPSDPNPFPRIHLFRHKKAA